ncbi:MAG: HrpE/YscL family type III secretion apparatus protein [Tissierellia bacterium]|nr:HrpE/YscL family type III secretion apparatus protein [Tissierellia bacterium]
MEVIRLLEELEDMVEVSNTIPLTGKVMVDKDEVKAIIEQIKLEIPGEVSEAKDIKVKASAIIEDANLQAKQIVQAAHVEAKKLVDEDEVVQEAQAQARAMMERAQEESDEIRRSAALYVDDLLEQTQIQFSDMIKTLNENRKELQEQ